MKQIRRVGVFDSGIGGLTVLASCQRLLPEVTFYYLGDNGNAPYGSRPPEEIRKLVKAALNSFRAVGTDAVVLACNTATAVCAEEMRRTFDFPIIGIEPAVRPAAKVCRHVLVLCTPRTAESGRLRALCDKFQNCRFTIAPAEGLAGEIERALTAGETPRLYDFLPEVELSSTCDPALDGVVLGCTHYLFFRREIAEFYGVPAFDGNEGTARRLKSVLMHLPKEAEDGILDHQKPPLFDEKSLEKKLIFMGKWSKFNEKVYKLNICSQNFL